MKNIWLWIGLGVAAVFVLGKGKTAQGVPTPPGTPPETPEEIPSVPNYAAEAAMLGLTEEQYIQFLQMAAAGQLNETTAALMGLTPEVFQAILANA